MNMARLLERSFAYSARFWIAAQNLGFANAVRVYSSIRSGSRLRSIHVLNRNVFYRSAADHGVMAHFFYPQTRIIDTPANPVRIIVDAGANIGIETIRMRHFHPQARILAVEADPGNFAVLTKNADEKVETLQRGVWSSDTGLRVLLGNTNQGFSVRPVEAGETAEVEAVTMRTLLQRLGGRSTSSRWTSRVANSKSSLEIQAGRIT
jgi:FkbM family methyltransferase